MLRNCPMKMQVESIETPIYEKATSLVDFISEHIKNFDLESKILVVTSKIISVAEDRLCNYKVPKDQLVRKEADYYLGEIGYDVHLTIKHGLLIPSAGIDESNSVDGSYILYPENPANSCRLLCQELKSKFKLKNFGVILSDSHTTPLRRGVTGIALAHWGFAGVQSKIGDQDLFGRTLKYTSINWADALAASATALMGESNECRPLALISCDEIQFQDSSSDVSIPLEEDLYYPVLKAVVQAKQEEF